MGGRHDTPGWRAKIVAMKRAAHSNHRGHRIEFREDLGERWVYSDTGQLVCLGTNADGSPIHPLARGRNRVPDDAEPIPWEGGDL